MKTIYWVTDHKTSVWCLANSAEDAAASFLALVPDCAIGYLRAMAMTEADLEAQIRAEYRFAGGPPPYSRMSDGELGIEECDYHRPRLRQLFLTARGGQWFVVPPTLETI